jgi:Thiolase, C-terminal domain
MQSLRVKKPSVPLLHELALRENFAIFATGTLITVNALYELERIGGRYALVTMCIGGGQGIAAIFERV